MENIFNLQKEHAAFLARAPISERINALKKLKQAILTFREEIKAATFKDFKKPYAETELTEIHTTLEEINVALKNIKSWTKMKKVGTPISLFGASSYIQKQPKGVVLIIAPWNYPFAMVMHPLIAAISAGNAVMIKPSEKTSAVSHLIARLVKDTFSEKEVCVFEGGAEVTQRLLDLPLDHIFFTGNAQVGKIIMQRAAEKLIPVTLELGGKSPAIVDKSANLKDAAEKLVWGKFVNAGQTCVAPDHIYIHKEIKEEFIKFLKEEIAKKFGKTPHEQASSKSFARIIDEAAYLRLRSYLEEFNIESMAQTAERFIPPTLLEGVTKNHKVMQEEIFGPILPLLDYQNIESVIADINARSKPLALYIFSRDEGFNQKILRETTSGGVAINHVLMHLANSKLPFGGIGQSGMGNYHGEFGFKTFGHERAVLKQGPITFTKFFFQDYESQLSKWAYKLIRFLE